MKKHVPFVSNTSDDMHCVPAVFRMVHKYFLKKDISWKEIDKILKVVSGKGTWTFPGLTGFAKKGISIIQIEQVDYENMYRQEPEYLHKVVGEKNAQYYLTKSNIASVIPFVPDFLKHVHHETRRGTVEEIIDFLKEGGLVGVEVNSATLNNNPGFNLHYILLYDFDEKYITFHDPGLPPIEGRRITIEDLRKCYDYPGANGGITVFKNNT
ncbi:hypothetical protein A2875_02815 [Candidatus Gottesmanbacteria bacterium RIFCSPHIGHO2_01_FULL_46_14]|uniref:Peptidase C39-like domain-containing protein n=3 Tax=Microgenomates group TaxID=1794810 RepID=A0A1F5ZPK9_9BACT|nr:MAG: hypothetical protein UU34_C0005G0019 [Candidatus Curtissbacteria bacterium GW2011_GWA1_41_11]OGG14436.1 MAG: hypothetical protein A2875_02815 [Candidatus Gottesmanbacteria bacterium RIFCSPHIGHO2_01_FULL_46_14]OGG28547.1 MAG: hypothetical protein A2971_03620 [Candidatus Gottesmanbacteria bacterium RIFCSPLOWO2_01_FULL_46_21]